MSASTVVPGCTTSEQTASTTSAIWGGYTDISGLGELAQAKLDAVVRIQSSNGGSGNERCTGTLISPRAVLTAAHCVNGFNAFEIRVGADNNVLKTKRTGLYPPAAYDPVPVTPQIPSTEKDVAVIFLSEPVLEQAVIVRPGVAFSPPYAAMSIVGWSPLNADGTSNSTYDRYRQGKFLGTLTPNTDLVNIPWNNGYYWRLYFHQGAGTQQGDSGGPLAFGLSSPDEYINNARVVVGVDSSVDSYQTPTFSEYADVTRGGAASWLNSQMLDSAHGGHGSAWHSQHGTNSASYWFGEVDYTGPCKNGGDTNLCYLGSNNGTDCDCDHWYDHGSVLHDNCPLVFNPDQADGNGDGMGDKCQDDQDGDGQLDYQDNCIYVRNTAQTDSNSHAELEHALQANAACTLSGVPGHVPTPSDPPTYVSSWHAYFLGDACDPDATTHTTNVAGTNNESDVCLVLHPGSGIPFMTYEGSCPVTLNTGLQFDSNIGNSIGEAQTASGTSAPTFCKCPHSTDSDWNVARWCQRPDRGFNCVIADDQSFPILSQPPDTTKPWRRISVVDGSSSVLYTPLATTHLQRKPYNSLFDNPQATSVTSTWDFRADLPTFFEPSTSFDLTGLLWTHVVSFSPAYGESQPRANYANNYLPIKAERRYSIRVADDWAYIPLRFDHCPLDLFDEFGNPLLVGFVQVGTTGGSTTMVLGAGASGLRDLSSNFTPSALSLVGGVYTGAYDLVSDSSYTVPVSGGGRPAILVDAWTTRIRGALEVGAGGIVDGHVADVPSQTWQSVRAYSSTTGQLYSVESSSTGSALVARDVAAALQGNDTQTSTTLWAPVGSLQALSYSASERVLFGIDSVVDGQCGPVGGCDTRLRLLRIGLDGSLAVLWATKPMSVLPSAMLTVSPQGTLTLGLNTFGGTSGGMYDVVLLDSTGRPLYSSSDPTTSLKSAPVSNRRFLTVAPLQAFSAQFWDFHVQYKTSSQLTQGLCGASWLKSAADNGTPLGNPTVDCP